MQNTQDTASKQKLGEYLTSLQKRKEEFLINQSNLKGKQEAEAMSFYQVVSETNDALSNLLVDAPEIAIKDKSSKSKASEKNKIPTSIFGPEKLKIIRSLADPKVKGKTRVSLIAKLDMKSSVGSTTIPSVFIIHMIGQYQQDIHKAAEGKLGSREKVKLTEYSKRLTEL